MSASRVRALLVAGFVAFSAPALALNPQPEPPIPYKGYEIVLTRVDPFLWRWEVIRPTPGHAHAVVASGIVHGMHAKAEHRAETVVNRLVTTGH